MSTVSSLWRYPVKAIGRECVSHVDLIAGHTMPGDRVWAIAHQNSKATDDAWSRCGNFLRACNVPALHAISAARSPDGTLQLEHPALADLSIDPDTDPDALLKWLAPLLDGTPYEAHRVIRVPDRGMTDAGFPSVTLCNLSSHKAVEQRAGLDLSIHRWRGNIWIEGLAPWEEFNWEGRDIAIGGARLRVIERTGRCKAIHSNPDTGIRDLNLLSVLEDYGHTDFSMQAEVIQSGPIQTGDTVSLL